jgi:hypothetical protein
MKSTALIAKTLMVGVAAAMLTTVAGCAAGSGAGTPAPTVTATTTVTASPAPATASPESPVDGVTAWHACAVLGAAEQARQSEQADSTIPQPYPYDPTRPSTKNEDGSWRAIVGFAIVPEGQGAKSIVYSCDIGGTLGAPTLIHWTAKDI